MTCARRRRICDSWSHDFLVAIYVRRRALEDAQKRVRLKLDTSRSLLSATTRAPSPLSSQFAKAKCGLEHSARITSLLGHLRDDQRVQLVAKLANNLEIDFFHCSRRVFDCFRVVRFLKTKNCCNGS